MTLPNINIRIIDFIYIQTAFNCIEISQTLPDDVLWHLKLLGHCGSQRDSQVEDLDCGRDTHRHPVSYSFTLRSALQTLPPYQKKSTMLDALCHALESFWSVNSTDESKGYSRKAIELILASQKAYLSGDAAACEDMLHAANLAGKAINITQTTAGHAMCYKLTSLFGIAHGHAAALCDRTLFPWMLRHTDKCIDTRGEDYLCRTFGEIASAFKCDTPEEASRKFRDLVDSLELSVPAASESDYEILKSSVNPTRLKNHPIALDGETIDMLYREILGEN